MIVVIRIRGEVKTPGEVEETLFRIRLRQKYACVVLQDSPNLKGILKHVRDYVAYGTINEAVLEKLIETRGQPIDKSKKIDAKKAVEGIMKGKSWEDLNLKPFFRLHPPRKGIKSKIHYPKGALGSHGADIIKLLERML
jgi:large subunit ribosomal protein L30